ncbi:uncharacterized protein At4g14450, chloroplastic-like [Actinidia eriantha]|uniref:uncharacterized protein At4g14450, chloroplastic-like n=1 Tax=Actinidia eriantha TaxID=165200 RepID=UPI00258AAD39|nr:uncharacterized protein At4g14450, chloroplastic-like [Actinidia eriantha]
MAEPPARSSGGRGQRSRLQRRAPASIQISPVSDWKAAIPLLSPLITSPPSLDLTVEIKSCTNIKHHPTEPEKPIVLKAWQHPAVPFCYEPPPPWVPFVCTGTLDRT